MVFPCGTGLHWNGNVVFMQLSSLTTFEVVKMTATGAASDENVKLVRFPFSLNNNLTPNRRHAIFFDGLVQERRNSTALAMELRLSCTKPYI